MSQSPRDIRRRWQYQRQRFPLLRNAITVALLSGSAVTLAMLSHGPDAPRLTAWPYVTAFLVGLLLLFQLRVIDEFNDVEQERRFGPIYLCRRGW